MTAKEKAKELYMNMYKVHDDMHSYPMCFDTAKQCAIIAVDEIINDLHFTHIGYGKDVIQGYQKTKLKFWNEVKQELINMK